MRVKLADAVTKKKAMVIEVRPDLYASKCDGCGKVFAMEPYCNDEGLAQLSGTFEHFIHPKGNMFSATVCSFQCAHDLFTGGWKKMPEYKVYAKAGIAMGRGAVTVTIYVKDESEIRREWKQTEESRRVRTGTS